MRQQHTSEAQRTVVGGVSSAAPRSASFGKRTVSLGTRLRRLNLVRTARTTVSVPPATIPSTSSVTVIVPARNEERCIEECVRSLLSQSYANYEVVVVDDGSEDATPAILKRLEAESVRLRVIQAPPLPRGWLGQTWAWETGTGQATSEWLLLTDADTQHHPGALAAAIAFAEARHLDMLSLMARQTLVSFWERAVMPACLAFVGHAGGSPAETNDPHSPVAKANGQFLLIRRAVHQSLGGCVPIRSIGDNDRAVARLVKGSGYRIMLADGRDWVQTRMYRSLREIWGGFSRIVSFIDGKVSSARGFGLAALTLGLAVWPFGLAGLALAWRDTGTAYAWWWVAALLGVLGILGQVATGVGLARWVRIPPAYGLLRPMGLLVLVLIILNSAFQSLLGHGVAWKGRRVV